MPAFFFTAGMPLMVALHKGTYQYITTPNYIYDGIGNLRVVLSPELLVQSHSGNHLNGFELEYTAYNFSGQPVKQLHVHSAAGESVLSEIYTYIYDDIGLPLAIRHRLGNGTETILADKVYDALGRLLKGKRNGNL